MQIQINDNRRIEDIQNDFSKLFPYLRIEFFRKAHAIGAPSSKKIMVPPGAFLKEINKDTKRGELQFEPTMTVAELEQAFNERFGLSVQVFRRSGKVWLETTATDSWTLEHQNEQGRELSELYKNRGTSD